MKHEKGTNQMIRTVSEMQLMDSESAKKHAGGKAREDLGVLFRRLGIAELRLDAPQEERSEASPIRKVLYHRQVARQWKEVADQINREDTLILQFPPVNHTLFLASVLKDLKRKEVELVAFVHDLELLRFSRLGSLPLPERWRLKREELEVLHLFDKIIIHNGHMKSYLHKELGIRESAMYSLELFDYLLKDDLQFPTEKGFSMQCIIAGKLDREKSAYIYSLPAKPDFELYGINYEEGNQENIHYHGSFLPEDLPFHMKGSFGLIWDGDSVSVCSGAWGNYLHYNNPHKTSLYLACGIPVITWNEAAIADFVLGHDVGLTVGSLDELESAIQGVSPQRYQIMKKNAEMISVKVRSGYYTRKVLEEAQIIPPITRSDIGITQNGILLTEQR